MCLLDFVSFKEVSLALIILIRNTKIKSSNTSGTKGVWWNAKREKWIAEIMIDNKKYYLGEFINKEEAIKTRKEAEIKYFGEFRNK